MVVEAGAPSEASQRRVVRITAATLLILAAAAVTLIAAGAFDPKPYGELITVDHPGPQTLDDAVESVTPLIAPWPASPERYSIRLTAVHTAGEPDSGYGLAIGDDAGRLVVALSPLGYLTVREERPGADPTDHLPWQSWPHVRTGAAVNEIWLDVIQDGGLSVVTIRLNRELLWSGELPYLPQQAGLYQSSFGAPATVDFSRVEWFAGP